MSAPEDAALREAAKAKVLEVMDMYVASLVIPSKASDIDGGLPSSFGGGTPNPTAARRARKGLSFDSPVRFHGRLVVGARDSTAEEG